jgi:electron transport complex protein RnfA
MNFTTFITIAFGSIFVSNFVLAKFLGLCPFLGVTQKMKNAIGMGIAVSFVMFLASLVTYLCYALILKEGGAWVKADLVLALKSPMYILVIATLVQLVEMFLKARVPALYEALGIYLPLITTNCAVMGVALLNTTDAPESIRVLGEQSIAQGAIAASWRGFTAGIGFMVAMLLMSGVRERIAHSDIPKPLQGIPIAFICTSLMAMAFLAFVGML